MWPYLCLIYPDFLIQWQDHQLRYPYLQLPSLLNAHHHLHQWNAFMISDKYIKLIVHPPRKYITTSYVKDIITSSHIVQQTVVISNQKSLSRRLV